MEISVTDQQSRAVFQHMELPHDTNGDLDWNTLGNLLTAHILGEVLHAKYVDYKYGRVSKQTRDVDTSWQFSYEENGIIVLKKIHSDSPIHAFMGRGVIELPIEEVTFYLRNITHREQWDKHLVDIEILREISNTDFLVRMHHRARKCLVRAERDFLYYERACNIDDRFVMTAMSVEHPDYPCKPRLTRAQIRPGSGWVLEPYDGSRTATLVSYVAHLDLMRLPPIITNRILQRQVMAVYYIRNILTPPSPRPSPSHLPQKHSSQQTPTSHDGNERGREDEEALNGESTDTAPIRSSGVHFEDPVSVYAFTRSNKDLLRLDSVPWDMDHHWNGDEHCHAHLAAREPDAACMETGKRRRSYSEGAQVTFHCIPQIQQNQPLDVMTEGDSSPEVKGRQDA